MTTAGPARALSVNQQKTFITDNAYILNRETGIAILSIVLMEIGHAAIIETGGRVREVNIDLDVVAATNSEVIAHIFNIVAARRDSLNSPAGPRREGSALH